VVSPGISVSSTNKIDRHEITEILLKVASNTITLTLTLLIQLLTLLSTVYILMFVFYIGQQTCLVLLHKKSFLASNNIYIIM